MESNWRGVLFSWEIGLYTVTLSCSLINDLRLEAMHQNLGGIRTVRRGTVTYPTWKSHRAVAMHATPDLNASRVLSTSSAPRTINLSLPRSAVSTDRPWGSMVLG